MRDPEALDDGYMTKYPPGSHLEDAKLTEDEGFSADADGWEEHEDPLRTARGMMTGVVLGACFIVLVVFSIKACVA